MIDTQNGTITTLGHTWPLYEREEERDGQRVLVLFMSPVDQQELDELTQQIAVSSQLSIGIISKGIR